MAMCLFLIWQGQHSDASPQTVGNEDLDASCQLFRTQLADVGRTVSTAIVLVDQIERDIAKQSGQASAGQRAALLTARLELSRARGIEAALRETPEAEACLG